LQGEAANRCYRCNRTDASFLIFQAPGGLINV